MVGLKKRGFRTKNSSTEKVSEIHHLFKGPDKKFQIIGVRTFNKGGVFQNKKKLRKL
jgi:hypothetical protein